MRLLTVLILSCVLWFPPLFALTLSEPQLSHYPSVATVPIIHSHAHYAHTFLPVMNQSLPDIPSPEKMHPIVKTLSLREAVALALRNNPDVRIAELQRIVDKFGLEVSIWQHYEPQWTPLTVTSTLQNGQNPQWDLSTGITFPSPSGTSVAIKHDNNLLGGMGKTTISIEQQLLRGFGFAVNRIPYQNAMDNEKIARLNFKNSVINVVINVINNYQALVEAYNNLAVSRQTLKSQEQSVWQSKLQVKVGQMSQSDLLQQQANLETTRLSVVQQQDALRNAYQNFLSLLGLVPSAQIMIDKNISTDNIKIPNEQEAIHLTLQHNISYQQALLQFNITKRQLVIDKDARKWQLSMESSVDLGTERSQVGAPLMSLNTNPTLAFNLSVPINDLTLKQAVVNDKVAIESTKINLEQQKEDLIRQVSNQWRGIQNQQRQINIAELAVRMQEQTLKNAQLKLKYGKTTVFEVNSLINQLLSQQVNLIGVKINYLNEVTALYQTLGLTLKKWDITLRY